MINDNNPNIDTFFIFKSKTKDQKYFILKIMQLNLSKNFNFGTEIIVNDICKITSLENKSIKRLISENKNILEVSDKDLLEEKYFINQQYRKIKKNLITKIADARISELSEKFYLNNINLKIPLEKINVIFLEINDQQNLSCFDKVYEKSFSFNNKFEIKILKKLEIEQIISKADNIVQFGWKKEAIPVSNSKKSFIKGFFQEIFQ